MCAVLGRSWADEPCRHCSAIWRSDTAPYASMFVVVSVPSLRGLRLQGAGNVYVTGFNSPNLTVELPGSGSIAAAGTATKVDVTISGEGTALLRVLIARDARAALSGDGSIMLTARALSPRGFQATGQSSA